ncbi:MAG: bifunctional GNAT family N-acetyltransferase/carbon-nitrogen hydrolase family protein [Flavobacteriales bacterium]|nr:bifunctional GNAT family N-acetyltransferase/carbon-nitrogen hydrolase family protein [Flavobacteriales bacterium]
MADRVEELVEVHPLNMEVYEDFAESMRAAYPQWSGALWKKETISRLLNLFPEGQLGIFVNGRLVGCALSIIVDIDKIGLDHDYRKVTGDYTFNTHSEKGDTLYGIEVFVHPEYRARRLGRRLYEARKEVCERLNLRAVMFGGRMPNYHNYSTTLKPKEYIEKVRMKEIHDPVLSFQLANDFHVVKLLRGYMPDDKQSLEFAVLLEWDNIYHNEDRFDRQDTRNVRLGLVQWQMRTYRDRSELLEQVEFFLEVVSGYGSDFAVFPELFNAPLMSAYNDHTEAEAIRMLAEHTLPIRDHMITAAVRYNVNIITGSMPLVEKGRLLNVGFLCRRDGTWERYDKIHITPNERRAWGITGGDGFRVMQTDRGKVGIVICYDCEFPELVRLLALDGMEILFVPFLTDTQNGFSRVRHCAQARAIENECFVAIAGSVGNLPRVKNMDIQYAQSAVFTPCDFPFPSTGVKGEATANTEMVLVVDVDLSLLKELHHYGTVQILKDRRPDLYSLTAVSNGKVD